MNVEYKVYFYDENGWVVLEGTKHKLRHHHSRFELVTENKSTDLTIPKERVQELINNNPAMKDIAQQLWPDEFKEEKLPEIEFKSDIIYINGIRAIWVEPGNCNENLIGKAFHLDSHLNWEIKNEEYGYSLIFTEKH